MIIKIHAVQNYYVYILKCNDKSYYTGITNNFERRLDEHLSGLNPKSYTYERRPLELVWMESFIDPDIAIMTEKKIKGWSRRKKEALINEDWGKLVEYSKNYTQFGNQIKKKSSTGSD